MEHLNALNLRLSNERQRLANAKTAQERELRQVWVKQIEKEIADEHILLGKRELVPAEAETSDDELLAALGVEA